MTTSNSWEDYASQSIKDIVKNTEEDENPHPFDLEFAEYLKAMCLNPNHCHVLATPLLELYSIIVPSERLSDRFGRLRDEIYVSIKLIDNDSREFLVFDSDKCDAAAVLFFHADKLEIRLENSKLNRPQWISKYFHLKLLFEDRVEKNEMVDLMYLDFRHKFVYDKQQCLELESMEYGPVSIKYIYFRHALVASVDCTIQKNDEKDDSTRSEDISAIVSGAISAKFKVRDTLISRVLFNGDPIVLDTTKLSWSSWLAVPAYSSLDIHVDNTVVDQEKIDTDGQKLKFQASDDYSETVKIVGQNWCFIVTVKWTHAYFFRSKLCECDLAGEEGENIDFSEIEDSDDEQSSKEIEASHHKRQEKRPRLHSIDHPLSAVNVIMPRMDLDPLPSLRLRPLNLVEVFSISVCPCVGNLDSSFILCGKIECVDFFDKHVVFKGDINNPSLVRPHQTISIVEPRRCYTTLAFAMRLDLKDDKGRDMSSGYLSWDFSAAALWLDRRMCSIVRGKDGFAAVHYTMFSDAVQARVGVSFVSKDGCQYQVCGRIKARYTGYRYSTQYDRKFYQSVLFQKGTNEYVILHDGADVPLSKLAVSVPMDESLIVFANLSLVVGGREEILRGKAEFPAQEADMHMTKSPPQSIGEGKNYGLVVSVSWG